MSLPQLHTYTCTFMWIMHKKVGKDIYVYTYTCKSIILWQCASIVPLKYQWSSVGVCIYLLVIFLSLDRSVISSDVYAYSDIMHEHCFEYSFYMCVYVYTCRVTKRIQIVQQAKTMFSIQIQREIWILGLRYVLDYVCIKLYYKNAVHCYKWNESLVWQLHCLKHHYNGCRYMYI